MRNRSDESNWKQIRNDILRRAGGEPSNPQYGARCEQCGVHNYAVGYRLETGEFVPDNSPYGRGWCDEANAYTNWTLAATIAEKRQKRDTNGNKWIIIVLSVDPAKLAALCQRCRKKKPQQPQKQSEQMRMKL